MKKKLLCLIFAICFIVPCMVMLCACGSTTYIDVSTMEELTAALTNDIDNDVIVLNADIDLKDANGNKALKIETGKHVLDLNGYTLKGVDNGRDSWHAIDLRGDKTQLKIKDSSEDQTGTIEGRCYGIQVSRGAKLIIDGGNFNCTTNGTFNQSVVVYGGSLEINGGKFTSAVDEIIFASSRIGGVDYETTVKINGGEFNYVGEASDWAMFSFDASSSDMTQKVTINGGTFNNNNLQYVVRYDENTTFVNNADIAENLIEAY